MKEKELRIALVCYGGISLAVYMHGVVKDILKLVRASRAYHSFPDVAERQAVAFHDSAEAGGGGERIDTEAVYFDLIKAIGQRLELRAVVDVIAGASAGGVNGVFLARALAHNLSMDDLRDLWLEEADVTRLLAPDRKARVWSKWILRPIIWGLTWSRLRHLAPDREIRTKLSVFLRSRWFRPPFEGTRLTYLFDHALRRMAMVGSATSSLVPAGLPLELFVTLTDFYGYTRHIPTHDPPRIDEREHRHTLRFHYQRWPGGEAVSDFEEHGIPALTFAARASSSFPGAFPPTQLSEIDEVLRRDGRTWSMRDRFLAHNLGHYEAAGGEADKTSFVDGSVLNNKPFFEAIQAIRRRPALRQVDRRLVYIDPDPGRPPPPHDGRVPGFFRTLKGALSDIPRNEPIFDDLALVDMLNQKTRRLRTVVEAARPRVMELVRSVVGEALPAKTDSATIATWRNAANLAARKESGFAYEGYVRLKLAMVVEALAERIALKYGISERSVEAQEIRTALDSWAYSAGVYPDAVAAPRRSFWRRQVETPAWVEFLQTFDLEFRVRRLRFVIRALNQLYPQVKEDRVAGVTTERLDSIKGQLYGVFDDMRRNAEIDQTETATVTPPLAEGSPAEFGKADVGASVDRLAQQTDLSALDIRLDRTLAEVAADPSQSEVATELIFHYIGFAFWDVLTFSIANRRDMGEFDEIRVDRISPDDCRTIRDGGAPAMLKGIDFYHFAAFFSRRYRENDYLWGRLHAAERLIDILIDTARDDGAADGLDARAFKKRAFLAVLESEAESLTYSSELIAALTTEVRNL